MPARLELKAEQRAVFGKHVRRLRRQGIIPANIYGHGDSRAIHVSDLPVVARYKVTDPPEEVLAIVLPPKVEVEAVPEEVAAPAEGEAAPAEHEGEPAGEREST